MIPILPLLDPLARLAAAALEHVNLRKKRLATKEKQDQAQRLKELEDSDLEQARLISELSENVEQLIKAVQSQIEENKARQTKIRRLVYAAVLMGIVSLATSLIILFR
jgi:predicted transcriptional regulator